MATTKKRREKHRLAVTYSEIDTFRTCRRRWELAYVEGLQPKVRSAPLDVGTFAHEGLRAYYRAMKACQASNTPTREAIGLALNQGRIAIERMVAEHEVRLEGIASERDIVDEDLARAIAATEENHEAALVTLEMCAEVYGAHDYEAWLVLAVEREFHCVLRADDGSHRSHIALRGTIDLEVLDRNTQSVIVIDHKTTIGNATDLDAKLDLDPQTRGYVYAARESWPAYPTGRIMLNVLRKVAPKIPKVNKNGMVSVAGCDTRQSLYLNALQEQELVRGLPRTQAQTDFAASLPSAADRWVHRAEHFVTEADLEEWRLDLRADAHLIQMANRGELRASRNGGACSAPWQPSCAYRSICHESEDSTHERDARFEVVPWVDELPDGQVG